MKFREIKPAEITGNVFDRIGKQWMLITAGTPESCNTMTASWGGLGVLWNKNVATCYIRPQRYTREFIEREDYFTISIFDEAFRGALNICGSLSGRDTDKIAKAGITPIPLVDSVAFEQAVLVLLCKKIYIDTIKPENFLDGSIDKSMYPQKDYHYLYIGEIQKVFVKDE